MAACGAPAEPAPTRVVLITLDTLRRDRLDAAHMPRTARWAAEGRIHERAYAATSSTQPTHATLFTGMQPWEHGVSRNGIPLGGERETLAERLHAAGFETRAVVASFPVAGVFGFAQGFDRYVEDFTNPLRGRAEWQGEEVHGRRFYSLAGDVTDRALAALDGWTAPRQFLWVHYFDAHAPYGDTLPGSRRGAAAGADPEAQRRLYDADVASLDRELGRLLARLEADAGSWSTHVVLTADHGESLGEGGLFGHETRVSPEQIEVPLVVRSPRVPAGRSAEEIGSADVFRLLLSLAGLPGPEAPMPAGSPAGLGAELGVRASGMRRSFAAAADDPDAPRLAPRYYAVVGGTLYAGNREDGVEPEDPHAAPPAEELADGLRALFGAYADELARTEGASLEDEGVREGLGALGYAE